MDNFLYKTYCEYCIVSRNIEPESITSELGLNPDRKFHKGDKSVSKNSGSLITKPHNLWAIKSNLSVSDLEDIKHHIMYLANLLNPIMDKIILYKNNSNIKITFNIWIETDNAGVGFNLKNDDLEFINSIAHSIQFSIICNSNVSD